MPANSYPHKMAAYMTWADDIMISNAAQLSAEELSAPRDTLFGSITGTFDHILVVAEMFDAHLEGRRHSFTARHRDTALPFEAMAERLRAMDRKFELRARDWSDAELAEVISFEFVGGGAGRMTREDIILHLVNHATYHRGFISALLFPYRVSMAPNDYTVFVRDVWRPAD